MAAFLHAATGLDANWDERGAMARAMRLASLLVLLAAIASSPALAQDATAPAAPATPVGVSTATNQDTEAGNQAAKAKRDQEWREAAAAKKAARLVRLPMLRRHHSRGSQRC